MTLFEGDRSQILARNLRAGQRFKFLGTFWAVTHAEHSRAGDQVTIRAELAELAATLLVRVPGSNWLDVLEEPRT